MIRQTAAVREPDSELAGCAVITIAKGRLAVLRRCIVLMVAALVFSGSYNVSVASGRTVDIDGLAASYLEPAEPAKVGAVIVPGSGPTDRNGNNSFGLRTDAYRQLADELAKVGIASVRYDKRGVAASAARVSAEDSLTITAFVDDAVAVSSWLARQPGIAEVVLIGHSEGGVVALLAAPRVKPASLVLLTTPGRPLAQVMREQLSQPVVPVQIRDQALPIIAALDRNEVVGQVPNELMGLFRPSIQGFLRSLMAVDPAVQLRALREPVLIVGGSKDQQVPRADFDALLRARPDSRVAWVNDMTHALKILPTGALQQRTYTDPALPLAPELVSAVVRFLGKP